MVDLKSILKRIIPAPILRATRPVRSYYQPQNRFDRKFNVATNGLIHPDQLEIDSARRLESGWYQPTPPAMFAKIMKSLPLAYERYVFVDIGSGAGAVLLYASEFPFKRIIGVEISSRLHEVAERNIANYRSKTIKTMKCRDLSSICMDATAYRLPPEPMVLFLFNPFKGRVLDTVVANVGRSLEHNPREIMVIYYHSINRHSAWDRAEFLLPIRRERDHTIYASQLERAAGRLAVCNAASGTNGA